MSTFVDTAAAPPVAQTRHKPTTRRTSSTRLNLWVDLAVFGGFLLATAPHFTGMTIHEWLGIAVGAAIVTHLLLHWQWLVSVTKRFFSRLPGSTRLNYALNAALFVAMTATIFTGLLISREALPLFGITLNSSHAWEQIHRQASDIVLYAVGLHVALHWRWIVNAVRTYIVRPVAARIRRPARTPALAPVSTTQEVEL